MARAQLNRSIRSFFDSRGVMEVETPLLASSTVTDVNLSSLHATCGTPGKTSSFYLQTSPEYAMKRLVASGSGAIFQICKAFRDGEAGRSHNPEFTLLEWYRPGFDHQKLMDEVDLLIGEIVGFPAAKRVTYQDAMCSHAGLDPVTESVDCLAAKARSLGVCDEGLELSHDDYLDLILTHAVQPALPTGAVFIYDFPATQAALATIRPGDPPVAERFELFLNGLEVANGYHELTDPAEQRRRFECDLSERRRRGLSVPPIDEHLLGALQAGLPACAGVAVGLDRVLMIKTGKQNLAETLTFSGSLL